MIIAIMAALAIPSMADARSDQHAYQDAGGIMQLFREARTRAIARGGAQVVSMTANGAADRGTFKIYEAEARNAGGVGLARTPIASCKTPTAWIPLGAGNAGVLLVDGVNLNGQAIEAAANVQTAMSIYTDPTNNTATAFFQGFVCYTPLGHSYVRVGAGLHAQLRRPPADHQPARSPRDPRRRSQLPRTCSSPPTGWRGSSPHT